MRNKMSRAASAAILSLSLYSSASAETKTWTTDTDWRKGKMEKVEIIKQGEPSSAALAACPELRIINIDGEFGDWRGVRNLDSSPQQVEEAGDAVAPPADIFSVWAANSDRCLYIKWQCAGAIDLDANDYFIYLDTDQNGSTGFKSSSGSWAIGAEYLIQDTNLFKYTGAGTDWVWTWVNVVSYALGADGQRQNNVMEIKINRFDIGETACANEAADFLFVAVTAQANEDFAPSDKLNEVYVYTYPKPQITVGGSSADWEGIESLVTDVQDMVDGDADLKAGYAVSDENYLYLRLDVYGHLNPMGHWYVIYLDTDQDNATGFTYGWWATGADYRVYLDEWNIGLQQFMGSTQCYDNWGWNRQLYQLKNTDMQWSWNSETGILEFKIPRADIGETQARDGVNILWRLYGDDAAPYYTSTAEYRYLK